MQMDRNSAGNAEYADPPRNWLKRAAIEAVVIALSLALPPLIAKKYALFADGDPARIYWATVFFAGWYTAWAIGFAVHFFSVAWRTMASGRTPYPGAFVTRRKRVRGGIHATLVAGTNALVGLLIATGVVVAWRRMDLLATVMGG